MTEESTIPQTGESKFPAVLWLLGEGLNILFVAAACINFYCRKDIQGGDITNSFMLIFLGFLFSQMICIFSIALTGRGGVLKFLMITGSALIALSIDYPAVIPFVEAIAGV